MKCRQVQKLRVSLYEDFSPQDFLELESAENMTDISLNWNNGASIEEVLPILRRCRHVRRLTLSWWSDRSVLPFEELCDFIMSMKHLTYLRLAPNYNSYNCFQLKTLRDKIKDLVLPRRPNFKFERRF
jgi:hypothetical protein